MIIYPVYCICFVLSESYPTLAISVISGNRHNLTFFTGFGIFDN